MLIEGPQPITRRGLLRLLGLAGATALTAACTTPSTVPAAVAPTAVPARTPTAVTASAPAPATAAPAPTAAKPAAPTSAATAPAAQAAEKPRTGGTLRMGLLGDLPNLDPHFTNGTDSLWNVWDRLVVYDAKLNPVPSLAESFDFRPDGKQLTLTLRKGVAFHTGRELTSEDVAWNLNRLKTDPVVQVTGYPALVAPLASVETPDKYTVILKSDNPWPGVFNLLALFNIADPVTLQGPNAKTQPVGTGPFKFGEYVQGDHLTLTRNPSYWDTGKPYLDGVQFTFSRDGQAMVTNLEGGALDVANLPPLPDLVRLQADSRYQVVLNPATGNKYVMILATNRAPTDSKLFRQALQHALDRQRIVSTVLRGVGVPSELPFGATTPAFDAAKDRFYAFDLDKAKALVAQSGLSNPTLDFNYSSASTEWANIGQLFQADLAKIGVTLNLKQTDPVQLSTLQRGRQFSGILGGASNFAQLHPSMAQGNPTWSSLPNNWASFNSDTLTQLMAGLVQEPDPAKQKQLYAQFNDYLLDESWAIVVATNPERFVATQRVHGLAHNMEGQVTVPDGWLAA